MLVVWAIPEAASLSQLPHTVHHLRFGIMENSLKDTVTVVPVTIGKIKAPANSSCYVTLHGDQSIPQLADSSASEIFAIIGFDIYTVQVDGIHRNGVLFVGSPSEGIAQIQAADGVLYLLGHDRNMYSCDTRKDNPTITLVDGWDASKLLPSTLAFAWGNNRGWILSVNDSQRQITQWGGPGSKPTVISMAENGPDLALVTALAAIDDTLFVADSYKIWSGKVNAGVADFTAVLALDNEVGNVAGMLGQLAYYNVEGEDGRPATARFLYIVSGNTGAGYIVYPNSPNVYTPISNLNTLSGNHAYGAMALDADGYLYFLTAVGSSGMNKINPIAGNAIYLDASAPNGITVLPNHRFALGLGEDNATTIDFTWGDPADPSSSSETMYYTTDPSDGYDKSYFLNDTPIVPKNPHGIDDGPALLLKLKLHDGNVLIGDIDIDPLFWKLLTQAQQG
jgi:hypothetical protein